jgi:hypothetical protein
MKDALELFRLNRKMPHLWFVAAWGMCRWGAAPFFRIDVSWGRQTQAFDVQFSGQVAL